MTRDLRERLRRQRDLHTRLTLLAREYCSGCGGEIGNWTCGCTTCWLRFNKRMQRGTIDPLLFEQLRLRNQEWAWQEAQRRESEGVNQPTNDDYYVLYPRRLSGSTT